MGSLPFLNVGDFGEMSEPSLARGASLNMMGQRVAFSRAQPVGQQAGELLVGGARRHRWSERGLGVCFEFLDFLVEHPLNFALGYVNHGHLHVDFGGDRDDRKSLNRHQAERLPRVRRYAKSHLHLGRFEELVVKGFF